MTITGEEYLASLDDGRRIVYRGETVDVRTHPKFAAVHLVAEGYDREVARSSPAGDGRSNRPLPQSGEDLRRYMAELSELESTLRVTRLALLGLQTAAGRVGPTQPHLRQRMESFVVDCEQRDLRVVAAITDAKGNRALGPVKQDDPDSYLRVVDESADGITVTGAKLHITNAAFSHELLVLPTKQMKPGEEQWAVACAVPVSAEGVTVLNAVPGADPADNAYFPHSGRPQLPYGFVVFDEVFVPWERVFLCGEVEHTGSFAHSLGLWLRLEAAAIQCDESDAIVGLAQMLAEANGAERIPHIRDKIADLILDATVVRAGFEAALAAAEVTPDGFATPDELYTNMAKYFAIMNMPKAYAIVQDIAGASILTAPMPEDLEAPATREHIDKYMRAGAGMSGEYRTRLFHAARDIAADASAAIRQVSYMHGGGGLYAQKLVGRRYYDMERAKRLAREMAGLEPESVPPGGQAS